MKIKKYIIRQNLKNDNYYCTAEAEFVDKGVWPWNNKIVTEEFFIRNNGGIREYFPKPIIEFESIESAKEFLRRRMIEYSEHAKVEVISFTHAN